MGGGQSVLRNSEAQSICPRSQTSAEARKPWGRWVYRPLAPSSQVYFQRLTHSLQQSSTVPAHGKCALLSKRAKSVRRVARSDENRQCIVSGSECILSARRTLHSDLTITDGGHYRVRLVADLAVNTRVPLPAPSGPRRAKISLRRAAIGRWT